MRGWMRCAVSAIVMFCGSTVPLWAQVTHDVPAAFPTIQSDIAAAMRGDDVIVQPGTYFERINFLGKNITVRSAEGPLVTTIDGGAGGSVVVFESGEGLDAVLEGFTVTNGRNSDSAGIRIVGSSPTIRGNRIVENTTFAGVAGGAAGIGLTMSHSLVDGNEIAYNTTIQGDGGGVGTSGEHSAVQFVRNVIHHNTTSGNGGAMYLRDADVLLENNTIVDNVSTNISQSSGINCYAVSFQAITVRNSIIR